MRLCLDTIYTAHFPHEPRAHEAPRAILSSLACAGRSSLSEQARRKWEHGRLAEVEIAFVCMS